MFFVIFCIGLACLVFLGLFCCIPLLAIAYAVASVEGASEELIKSIPRYRYRSFDSSGAVDNFMKLQVVGLKSGTGNNGYQGELVLPSEDSVSTCSRELCNIPLFLDGHRMIWMYLRMVTISHSSLQNAGDCSILLLDT